VTPLPAIAGEAVDVVEAHFDRIGCQWMIAWKMVGFARLGLGRSD